MSNEQLSFWSTVEQRPFADYPQSIGAILADRHQDGSLWTPRDALIDLLRDIDAERVNVQHAVIVYRFLDVHGDTFITFSIAGPLPRVGSIGMLSVAQHKLLEGYV